MVIGRVAVPVDVQLVSVSRASVAVSTAQRCCVVLIDRARDPDCVYGWGNVRCRDVHTGAARTRVVVGDRDADRVGITQCSCWIVIQVLVIHTEAYRTSGRVD